MRQIRWIAASSVGNVVGRWAEAEVAVSAAARQATVRLRKGDMGGEDGRREKGDGRPPDCLIMGADERKRDRWLGRCARRGAGCG